MKGDLFNYHADLLHQEKNIHLKNQELNIKTEPGLVKEEIKTEVKTETEDDKGQDDFTNIADKIFEEAQDLLMNSPWILGFGNGISKDCHDY